MVGWWWLAVGWPGADAAQPVVVATDVGGITFDTSPSAELQGAIDDLRRGAFDAAGRRLTALAEAGGGADVRYLQAIALYEAGELRLADGATAAGLALAPDHAGLGSLRGLVLADLGKGPDALRVLAAARDHAGSDAALGARIAINEALVHLDAGSADAAAQALARARPLAAGAPDLVARVDALSAQVDALRGSRAAPDPLGRVGDRVAAGDLAGAEDALPSTPPADRRDRLRVAIATAVVARAQGRLDAAQRGLEGAAAEAAQHGLIREQAAAEAQLGVVFGAMNRPEVARSRLELAVSRVAGTSFKVAERSYRLEAGRMALRAGDVAGARAQLAAAQAIVVDDPSSAAAAELRAGVAAKTDPAAAAAAFAEAATAFEARGQWMDAARVGCGALEVSGSDRDRDRALAAFDKAHEPLGAAHAGIARGLGLASRGDLDGAMSAFAGAATAAEVVRTDRGAQIARIAKENAAKVVVDLSDGSVALAEATKWGVDDLVARNTTYRRGRAAYDAALVAYHAGKYDEAYAGFSTAVTDLESIGEGGYARVARRGRAWARFNAYTHAEPANGFPIWQGLVEEGTLLQDPELRVRSMAAVALAAAELGRPEAVKSLRAAESEADAMGLRPLAGQCAASRVEVEPALTDKVTAARRAFALRDGDAQGVYAMYSAALAAYDQGDNPTAIELAGAVLPVAGKIAPSVKEVLDAATAAKGG